MRKFLNWLSEAYYGFFRYTIVPMAITIIFYTAYYVISNSKYINLDTYIYTEANPLLRDVIDLGGLKTINPSSEDTNAEFNVAMDQLVHSLSSSTYDVRTLSWIVHDCPSTTWRISDDPEDNKVLFSGIAEDRVTLSINRKNHLHGAIADARKQNNVINYILYRGKHANCQNVDIFRKNLAKYPSNLYAIDMDKNKMPNAIFTGEGCKWLIEYRRSIVQSIPILRSFFPKEYYYGQELGDNKQLAEKATMSEIYRKMYRVITFKKVTYKELKELNNGTVYRFAKHVGFLR